VHGYDACEGEHADDVGLVDVAPSRRRHDRAV